jgi:uncharacterized protein YndB with AHSA1/START domain
MKQFKLQRTINAPRALVFAAWTQAEHLEHWWGPTGLGLEVVSLDLRPGGMFHYAMVTPEGSKSYGRFVYQEILAPEKLAYIVSFADKHGEAVRAPFSAAWPVEMWNEVTFEDQDGATLITLTGRAHNATDEEIKTFTDGFQSMELGFTGTLNQLENYLKTL